MKENNITLNETATKKCMMNVTQSTWYQTNVVDPTLQLKTKDKLQTLIGNVNLNNDYWDNNNRHTSFEHLSFLGIDTDDPGGKIYKASLLQTLQMPTLVDNTMHEIEHVAPIDMAEHRNPYKTQPKYWFMGSKFLPYDKLCKWGATMYVPTNGNVLTKKEACCINKRHQ